MQRPDHAMSGPGDPVFTALYEALRRRLLDLAFRILLDLRDSEDVVQEALLRVHQAGLIGSSARSSGDNLLRGIFLL